MAQLTMFVPTAQGEQAVPIQARLVTRRTDPETSRRAAVQLVQSGALTDQQRIALRLLAGYGPGTTWQIADRALMDPTLSAPKDRQQIHYLLARRLPELARAGLGLVRVQRQGGHNVVVDGSRVWELVPEEVEP